MRDIHAGLCGDPFDPACTGYACEIELTPELGYAVDFVHPINLPAPGARGIYSKVEWTGDQPSLGDPGFREFICASEDTPRYDLPLPVIFEKLYVASNLRTGGFIHQLGRGDVFVGTELGVFATADPDTILLGQSTQLEAIVGAADGGVTYQWSSEPLGAPGGITPGDENLQILTVSPSENTTYTVRAADASGTQGQASVNVSVIDYFVTVTADPDTIVVGQTSELMAVVTGGTPPYAYLWTPADGLDPSDAALPNPIVDPAVDTTYTVTVTDSSGTPRITSGSVAVVVTPPPEPPDLTIQKRSLPLSLRVGDSFSYLLTIENIGLGDATGVVVTDILPADVQLDGPLPAGCNAIQDVVVTVVCGLDDVAAGERVQLTIDAAVAPVVSGPIINIARVESNEVDVDPSNNAATAISTICANAGVPCADLEITKSGAPQVVEVGANAVFDVGVTNRGPDDATNVIVTDQLPQGVMFDPANSSFECTDSGAGWSPATKPSSGVGLRTSP